MCRKLDQEDSLTEAVKDNREVLINLAVPFKSVSEEMQNQSIRYFPVQIKINNLWIRNAYIASAEERLTKPRRWTSWPVAWPRGYKTFFMLNSVEHENFPAHKC